MRTKKEDLFLNFLIKEKELDYIEKIHEQATIKYIENYLKIKQKDDIKISLLKKIKRLIINRCHYYFSKYINYINQLHIRKITDEDKKDKTIIHKQFKHRPFIIHYLLIRSFKEQPFIDKNNYLYLTNFQYHIFIRIEDSGLISKPHLKQSFLSEKDAIQYFNDLLLENKNKSISNIIKSMSSEMDEKYTFLRDRVNLLQSKLENEII